MKSNFFYLLPFFDTTLFCFFFFFFPFPFSKMGKKINSGKTVGIASVNRMKDGSEVNATDGGIGKEKKWIVVVHFSVNQQAAARGIELVGVG